MDHIHCIAVALATEMMHVIAVHFYWKETGLGCCSSSWFVAIHQVGFYT